MSKSNLEFEDGSIEGDSAVLFKDIANGGEDLIAVDSQGDDEVGKVERRAYRMAISEPTPGEGISGIEVEFQGSNGAIQSFVPFGVLSWKLVFSFFPMALSCVYRRA